MESFTPAVLLHSGRTVCGILLGMQSTPADPMGRARCTQQSFHLDILMVVTVAEVMVAVELAMEAAVLADLAAVELAKEAAEKEACSIAGTETGHLPGDKRNLWSCQGSST